MAKKSIASRTVERQDPAPVPRSVVHLSEFVAGEELPNWDSAVWFRALAGFAKTSLTDFFRKTFFFLF